MIGSRYGHDQWVVVAVAVVLVVLVMVAVAVAVLVAVAAVVAAADAAGAAAHMLQQSRLLKYSPLSPLEFADSCSMPCRTFKIALPMHPGIPYWATLRHVEQDV